MTSDQPNRVQDDSPCTEATPLATLFLGGDVMTGRGIDQILPHPCDPTLHEPSIVDATDYVRLAEQQSGPIPRAVNVEYIWGEALAVLQEISPAVRIINLETAVTTSDDYWRNKQIHYRMNPRNVDCLRAAGINCCVLANNHVLDWGYSGFEETLQTLETAGIRVAGAGRDAEEAQRPAVFELPHGNRLLVFGMGSPSSGIP